MKTNPLKSLTPKHFPSVSLSSDSVQVAEAIKASELSYRRLFETTNDGILILDAATGRINHVNPFLVNLLGFPREEIIGKTVAELSPLQDVEENQVMLQRLQADGYVRYEDLPMQTKDGRHVAMEFVCNVYQAGLAKVIQCNVRDITERKRAEMAVIRLAAIVASSDDAIIGIDLDGTITSWNNGAEKIFGYSACEMSGTSIMRLVPASRHHEEEQILKKIKRGENMDHFETERQNKKGKLISISVTESPIKNRAGKIIGASKVARDITERIAAEKTIRLLNVNLERRVTERTAQMKLANKDLEAFSYSISHDLRAPLRHILSYVKRLQQEKGESLSEQCDDYLTKIFKSAKWMERLIEDLLNFFRLGGAGVAKKKVSLDDLVRETLDDFQAETKDRHIAWQIHSLPPVMADRSLLKMALVNLISNAVKFTSARVEAKIEIGCLPRKSDETVIFIRDNGAGFDPQYGGKLFGVFQRLHSQSEFEGTGIGLANVQRIIQRHGGKIWAEGAVDSGATFYFSIPKLSEPTNGH